MNRLYRTAFGTLSILLFVLLPQSVAAVTVAQGMDTARLTQLYATWLMQEGKDSATETRISNERARIRAVIDDALNAQLNAVRRTQTGSTADIAGSFDRQQAVVDLVREQVNEVEVDLELLDETNLSTIPEVEMQQARAEQLAQRALLEERDAALQFFRILEEQRLRKLRVQQLFAQFQYLSEILQYLIPLFITVLIARTIHRILRRRIDNPAKRYRAVMITSIALYGLLCAYILVRVSVEYPRIITSFAIVGAGLALAFQDVVKDLLGWAFIVQGRRFTFGQRITIGAFTGDVIDIGFLRTTLLEVSTTGTVDVGRTGKTLSVPNALILSQPLLNYNTTSDYIRVELPVTVTYESDWAFAKGILERLLRDMTGEYTQGARQQQANRMRQFYVAEDLPGPNIYVELAPSGVLFILRFYVPIGERRNVVSCVCQEILRAFAASIPPIELAYNTSRVYATTLSGKETDAPPPVAG